MILLNLYQNQHLEILKRPSLKLSFSFYSRKFSLGRKKKQEEAGGEVLRVGEASLIGEIKTSEVNTTKKIWFNDTSIWGIFCQKNAPNEIAMLY